MKNELYYVYVDTQRLLKRMNELINYEYKNQDIVKSFDIVLQLVLLAICFNDKTVDRYETEFIDKITLEDDILVKLSKKLNKDITWSSLTKLTKSARLDELLASLKNIFSSDIDFFITFLGKADGLTEEDFSNKLYQNIKQIAVGLALADGDLADLPCIDEAINDIFYAKYLSLKNMVK